MPLKKNESLLIPCYNGNQSARVFLTDIARLFAAEDVVLVNDGSNEEFSQFLESLPLRVISHSTNRGKGAALRTGFEYLKTKNKNFILTLDCDGQHAIESIASFFESEDKADCAVIVGKRDFSLKKMPFFRILSNRITTAMVSLKARRPVFDSQCGYRLYNLNRLSERDWPQSATYQWESEVLIRLGQRGEKIGKVPVPTLYGDEVSHIRPLRDTLRFLKMWIRF